MIDVVRRMGLLERIASHSLQDRSMAFLDGHGDPIAVMPSREDHAEGLTKGYEIERDVLLDMLFSEVRDTVEFVFDESISGLEDSAEEVAVTFTSGRRRSFRSCWVATGHTLPCGGCASARSRPSRSFCRATFR